MSELKLKEIVSSFIKEDDKQDYLKRSLGAIEREINSIDDKDQALIRAEKLIGRRAAYPFMKENWREIERILKSNLGK